jgi:hypothetical protein
MAGKRHRFKTNVDAKMAAMGPIGKQSEKAVKSWSLTRNYIRKPVYLLGKAIKEICEPVPVDSNADAFN